jgi:hypothetical protein
MWPEAGESLHGCLQMEETGKQVAAQSMKLEASEQKGLKMQPQSKPKGLEAPWRVTGEFMFKAEKAGVWGPQKMEVGKHIHP